MKAVATYDFRLRDEEFGRMTPQIFWELWERRETAFKRQSYLHGIVAAAVYNVQRSSASQHLFEPTDFVPRSPESSRREELILIFRKELNSIPAGKHADARRAYEETLKKMGRTDTDEIMTEVFRWIN
jgi:hypothetical protein